MPVPERKTKFASAPVARLMVASRLSPMVPDLPKTDPVRVPVPCSTAFPEEKTIAVTSMARVPAITPEKVATAVAVRIVFPSAVRELVVVPGPTVKVPVPDVGVAACAMGSKSKAIGRRNNALVIFIFFTFRTS